MRSKKSFLVLLPILSGLVLNILVYGITSGYEAKESIEFSLCSGNEVSVVALLEGGAPLKSEKYSIFSGSCAEIKNSSTLNQIQSLIFTWQFFVNWLIYALFLFLVFFGVSRYANTRD